MRLLINCQIPPAEWTFHPITGFRWPETQAFFWLQMCQLKWSLALCLLLKRSMAGNEPPLHWEQPQWRKEELTLQLCAWHSWKAFCFHPGSELPSLCLLQDFWKEGAIRDFEAVSPHFTATWTTQTHNQEDVEATDSVRHRKEAKNILADTHHLICQQKRQLWSSNYRHPTDQQCELYYMEALPNLSPVVSAAAGTSAEASMARIKAKKTYK